MLSRILMNCFKITDERFLIERINQYQLILEVQFSRLRFIVVFNNNVITLEDHFLGSDNSVPTFLEKIHTIFEEHPFLKQNQWESVKLISDFQIHTLIPIGNFNSDFRKDYIHISFPTVVLEDFDVFHVQAQNQVLVYATLKKVNDFFREYFTNLRCSSTVAEAFLYHNTYLDSQVLGVISDNYVDVLSKNTKTKNTITARMLLRDLNQSKPIKETLLAFGEITPYGTIYNDLSELYNEVIIGETPQQYELPVQFKEVACQRYFTLLTSSNLI